jgi:hypothetical protein
LWLPWFGLNLHGVKRAESDMTSIDAQFCRALLNVVHAEVRKAFPQIPNLTKACGVVGGRGQWFAEIDVPGLPRFTWDGHAFNATQARAEAWQSFMRKHAPDEA